jgi:hypothetical protein
VNRVISEISTDNNWRYRDFAKFKKMSLKVDKELWYRMCVPMIYAHWEGFVINSLKTLITHLNQLELAPNNIKTNLIVICLEESYKSLSGKQSFGQRVEFTNKFQSTLNKKVKFQKKINIKSNLRSSVLEELCNMYCFNFETFKGVTSQIDKLVNVRNRIAHGENSIVLTEENLMEYIETVEKAMDLFLEEINIFVENKKYLLSNIT